MPICPRSSETDGELVDGPAGPERSLSSAASLLSHSCSSRQSPVGSWTRTGSGRPFPCPSRLPRPLGDQTEVASRPLLLPPWPPDAFGTPGPVPAASGRGREVGPTDDVCPRKKRRGNKDPPWCGARTELELTSASHGVRNLEEETRSARKPKLPESQSFLTGTEAREGPGGRHPSSPVSHTSHPRLGAADYGIRTRGANPVRCGKAALPSPPVRGQAAESPAPPSSIEPLGLFRRRFWLLL